MRTPAKVRVGDAPDTRVVGPVSQTDIVRFAGAGGDFNPLHHDPGFVATSGFPGVIAMGQMQAGILAGWLSDTFGVEHVRSFGVRFVAPVFLGDTLTLGGTVVTIAEANGESLATLDLVASGDKGPVVTGSATVVVAAT
ncbi:MULTISPECIES: MaoC/PaaZ C-terminal domain-containing protein [unclassified Rhodococcus (in: high G+C Gram-positive bacteria)]|uniref:MaoC family dehydratase n=1 Tax=unclassified Rhodococcus (in: high G+C Gram-positive bacteria) TaxID=192944 RepID=UPI001185C65F|nr:MULTISPECIES: MaoC/PaaZ C-terminal domain-containing protein [unclassified Rhodococcus (in: high G+C Gram-positive bacteria)]MBC2642095.1 acyl dehydratase [Rhodococcus sp. 3A]MBC2893162.1 acyl dehydratase [Rhodococcus sp. 4CII]QDQ90284.1 acyl dehydratase [Rhodococcus sp. WB9]